MKMQQGIFLSISVDPRVSCQQYKVDEFWHGNAKMGGPFELLSSYKICLTAANNTVNTINNIVHHTLIYVGLM